MTLRVVGAGFGRTGTHSLKIAFEKLLGAPCYHMIEVFAHPEHVPIWHNAAVGKPVDWEGLMTGYAAAVDWPASAYWPELMKTYPDALVLLSVRDPGKWWESASETIMRDGAHDHAMITPEWKAMVAAMFAKYWTGDTFQRDAAIAAFKDNTARVLREVPSDRLLVWEAKDGWGPICERLGIAVPDEPFPRSNTREEWRAREAAFAAAKAAQTT
jgi:hypothetical protein